MDALFSLMEKQYPTFSKGQRRIAEYIFNSYDDAAFMTAAKLGERVGVSESTVVRFAYMLAWMDIPRFRKRCRSDPSPAHQRATHPACGEYSAAGRAQNRSHLGYEQHPRHDRYDRQRELRRRDQCDPPRAAHLCARHPQRHVACAVLNLLSRLCLR